MGRMAMLAFGLGYWWAGDGGRWMQGRLSVIAGGNGGIIMECAKLVHPQRCSRCHQYQGCGGMATMVVGWVASTLRSGLRSGDSWLGYAMPWRMVINCCKALTWLSHNGARGELGDRNWRAWAILAMLAVM